MSNYVITPKDNIKKVIAILKKGDVLTFSEGKYPGSITIRDINELTVKLEGAIILGGRGIKFERCNELIFQGWGEVRESTYHGLMVVDSVGLDILSATGNGGNKYLEFEANALSGILTGNVSEVVSSYIRAGNNGGHGIYYSQSGDDLSIVNCVCYANARCGIQVNANQPKRKRLNPRQDAISKRVYIRYNTLIENQKKYGAAAINMAACQRGEISYNTITNHQGRHGIALWDDGTNKAEFACHDFDIDYNKIELNPEKAKAGIDIGKGCTRIKVGKYNTYKGIPSDKYVVSH